MAMDRTDAQLMEASLEALGDRYDGMAAELFDRYIADHPHYAPVFLNPEAARERMTRETLEAMLGLAAGEYWVDHAVTNFIDLHHNYADFTPQDYADWFALVTGTMASRAGATAIYFLLEAGQASHWHRVDAAELWLWHAGSPLTLHTAAGDSGPAAEVSLGPDIVAGEAPQHLIPTGHWQAAQADRGWTLVSCVVSPAFEFSGFELAAEGWSPGA